MRIDELLARGKPTVSFEFFPPKTEAGFASLFQSIDALRPLNPGYVSVTYGAGGSTRQKTVELVERIQRELAIRSMAHLTCVGHTAEEIGSILDSLWNSGITATCSPFAAIRRRDRINSRPCRAVFLTPTS